jgi:hypothetical protein
MDVIKQFIEEHIPKMDTPEKVYQLFAGLGYKTLDPSYRGKEAWGLKEKDKELVREIYAIPDEDKFIECAVALKADVIITGDKTLKTMDEYMGIKILAPQEFLKTYKTH